MQYACYDLLGLKYKRSKCMKKIINISFVLVVSLLIGIVSVNAEEYYYINDNGITFTKEEYDFFTAMYYDGYQALMTQEDMARFDGVEKDASKVETKVYDESKIFVPSTSQTRGTVHETNAKRLQISKSGSGTLIMIAVSCTWKSNPNVRSYDLIGARLNNTSLASGISSSLSYSGGTIYPSATKTLTNGFGASIKLPSSGTNIVASQTYAVYSGGRVYASYQHAKSSVTLNQSQSFGIGAGGLGGVFTFSNGNITAKYDAMGGVYIDV